MDIPLPAPPDDPAAHLAQDRRRLRRSALLAALAVAALWWIKAFELMTGHPLGGFGVRPHDAAGLLGVLLAPLLHGSLAHLVANTLPIFVLLLLAIATVPRATVRALPTIWLGSGLFVWLIGEPGSVHIGASGLAHGLMFLLFLLGLLRRDRQAIATALVVFFLYGSMLLTVFPRELGISWQSHLGGALFGALSALLWRRLDPAPARKHYDWEDETVEPAGDAEFEPPRPAEVPVLWRRDEPRTGDDRVIVPFRRQ